MNRLFFHFLYVTFLAVFSILSACSGVKPINLTTNLEALSYLNPNIDDQPAPVVVTLYQLKSADSFQKANFLSLYSDAINILGSDLLSKSEIEIRPKQKLRLNETLSPDTTYIGIVAAFRNPDKAQWRQLIPIKSDKKINLIINLSAQNILAKLN